MPPPRGAGRKGTWPSLSLPVGDQIRFAQPRRPLPGAPKMSGEIGLLEHLWGRSPFSVRRGAEVTRRADRGEGPQGFPPLRAARMLKPLLLLCGLYCVESAGCYSTPELLASLDVNGCPPLL